MYLTVWGRKMYFKEEGKIVQQQYQLHLFLELILRFHKSEKNLGNVKFLPKIHNAKDLKFQICMGILKL